MKTPNTIVWIYPTLLNGFHFTTCICGLVKVVLQSCPGEKKSSALRFNMCFACVCFCVQPLCLNVIWYLHKRIFPFYVVLAQKRPWAIACACTHTHGHTQMKNIAARTGMKLKGKLRYEEKLSPSPLDRPLSPLLSLLRMWTKPTQTLSHPSRPVSAPSTALYPCAGWSVSGLERRLLIHRSLFFLASSTGVREQKAVVK